MLSLIRWTMIVGLLFTVASTQKTTHDKPARPDQDPCAKANTQYDLNQCNGEQYHKADARLNSIYTTIRDDLQGETDKTAITKLTATERTWIQYRDLHCDAARHQFEGGNIAPTIWAECMRLVTEHRIQELKDAYPVDGEPRK